MSGKQPIERIPPIPPTPSLLTSMRPLPDVDWHSGIAWVPLCGLASHAWAMCPPLETEKTLSDGMADAVATDPFMIYTGVECEFVLTPGGDRLVTAVTEINEAQTAAQFAAALWLGTGLPTTADANYGYPPTLRRAATDVTASFNGPGPLDDVVAALLQSYEDCTGGLGGAVIHMPSSLLTTALGGGPDAARVCWPEGSLYRGPLGSVVSPGPGYPHGNSNAGANGYGPISNASGSGALYTDNATYKGNGYNEAWVYISGPIEFAVTPVDVVGDIAERNAPARMNRMTILAERSAIVRFDPCCVFAAKATNPAGEVS